MRTIVVEMLATAVQGPGESRIERPFTTQASAEMRGSRLLGDTGGKFSRRPL